MTRGAGDRPRSARDRAPVDPAHGFGYRGIEASPQAQTHRDGRMEFSAAGADLAGRPMPRSTSAPTIAACWSRAPTGDEFRVVDAFSRIIRLGEGSPRPAGLSEPAMARAVEGAVDLPRQDAQPRRHPGAPDRHRSLPHWPTTASEFLDPGARTRSGVELEIVDRETEAMLAAIGCTPLVDPACGWRHSVRYRWRLLGAGPSSARPPAVPSRSATRRTCAAGCRCRSVS